MRAAWVCKFHVLHVHLTDDHLPIGIDGMNCAASRTDTKPRRHACQRDHSASDVKAANVTHLERRSETRSRAGTACDRVHENVLADSVLGYSASRLACPRRSRRARSPQEPSRMREERKFLRLD